MPNSSPVILITGASSGIGEMTARLFARRGYRVAITARRLERLEQIASEIRADKTGTAGGDAFPIQSDVSDPASVETMVKTVLDHYGQIDLLFNNAGFGRLGWLESLDPARDIQAQLNTNLLGLIYCSRAVLPHMIHRRQGHIINMSSIAGLVGTPTYTIYAASKFGVRGFSQALRREVSIWGVQVSTIFPGGVETEFAEKSGSTKRKTGISTPRWLRLTAEQVAEAVYRLARRPRAIAVVPWMMRYSVWLNNMVPGLVDKIIERRFVKRERGL
ncbi:MAG: SDR family NAD(P)-dependent oxidoreductase [Anaerolineales bacterium]|nr:SDR family NAD(P)-dependent oxidoreductase [Anaerolineales bacterium]